MLDAGNSELDFGDVSKSGSFARVSIPTTATEDTQVMLVHFHTDHRIVRM